MPAAIASPLLLDSQPRGRQPNPTVLVPPPPLSLSNTGDNSMLDTKEIHCGVKLDMSISESGHGREKRREDRYTQNGETLLEARV
ncbi:hypothetical protein NL676_033460 [Syzygium grande]|nr:hypothetical protein NL676_033460 [Syzygium grande]